MFQMSDLRDNAVDAVISKKYASIAVQASRAIFGEVDITIYKMLKENVV